MNFHGYPVNWSRILWEPRSTLWEPINFHFHLHTQCENLRSSRATTTKQKPWRTFPKVSYRQKVSNCWTQPLGHSFFFHLSFAPWRFMSSITGQTKPVKQSIKFQF